MKLENVKISTIITDKINDNYYTVLSVELGNTTLKSIINTTNIQTNKNYQLIKLVKHTRDIRLPKESEEIFGYTIWNKALSKQAIEEAITNIILESLKKVNLKVSDLDFVVRSTGIVAISKLSKDMGIIIKALSQGCLNAGIIPSQMTSPFKKENIPQHIRKYSFFDNIQFDGSVCSVSSTDMIGVTSNEMESELVTAGIKLASKNSSIDYRNPVISIDMGTTLAGQITDDSKPYAKLVGNYVGLAGGIGDILLRNSKTIKENESTIDLQYNKNKDNFNEDIIHENTIKLHEFVNIMEVPHNKDIFGLVAIDSKLLKTSQTKIIGSDIKNVERLTKTFTDSITSLSKSEILIQIDSFYAYLIKRLIDTTDKLGLLNPDITLGITGRAGTTGYKAYFLEKYLSNKIEEIILVQDGLALGSLMMARCMNSLGTPINPIGGSKKGMCIMQQRIKINKQ